jgi:fructokinase
VAASEPTIAGVELGGTKCICILGSAPHSVIERVRIETREPRATLAEIETVLERWQRVQGFAALGIASFGPLDLDPGSAAFGSIVSTTKPGWSGTALMPLFARFGVPVAIDTDVVGAARAEQRWGAARQMSDLAYITIGTGIGVGAIVGGRPLGGRGHAEMGHLRVPRFAGDDFPGVCSYHRDCVEGLASGPAIAARHGPGPVRDDWPGWAPVEHALAMLVHNIMLSLQPERILIGGGVGERPGLVDAVRERARQSLAAFYTAEGLSDDFLMPAGLGNDAGPLGALALGLDALGR